MKHEPLPALKFDQPGALTYAELSTILAALRLWQRTPLYSVEPEFDIATGDGTIDPLDNEDIDSLCERLNCGEIVRIEGGPSADKG